MKPQQIKDMREDMGLSQKELGIKLRLAGDSPDRTVRAWESGKTPISGPASLALEYIYEDFLKRRTP